MDKDQSKADREKFRRLSSAARAAAWRASVDGLPLLPPLSDAAISRESIYGPRRVQRTE